MTKKQKTLELLRQAGEDGVDNRALVQAGVWRYSARIKELRDAGYNIRTERLEQGHFRFVLTEPSPPKVTVTEQAGSADQQDAGGGPSLFPPPAPPRPRGYADPEWEG